MKDNNIQISELIDTGKSQSILEEIKTIALMIFPDFDIEAIDVVYGDAKSLFEGNFPGYQKCNTLYHDFKHTTDALLAMARLIHGAVLQGIDLCRENVALGLNVALFHDSGYIQTSDDTSGTGAKYTLSHIQRSIEFMNNYFRGRGFSEDYIKDCKDIVMCTGLNTNIDEIQFSSKEVENLGKMLGAADLMGQTADRLYLEKTLLLFYEFVEGKVSSYENELDLFRKTLDFYSLTEKRFAQELDNVYKFATYHFQKRWGINKDLYEEARRKNINYLRIIIDKYENEYRNHLRRGGIVDGLIRDGK